MIHTREDFLIAGVGMQNITEFSMGKNLAPYNRNGLLFSVTGRKNAIMEGCLESEDLVVDHDLNTGKIYF